MKMKLKDFYNTVSGDYNEVLSRLGKEERVLKFVKLFIKTGDFEALEKAIQENDGNNAFEYAHRLKGNALNIGFTKLASTTSSLVEPLRSRVIDDPGLIKTLFEEVAIEYRQICNNASNLE